MNDLRSTQKISAVSTVDFLMDERAAGRYLGGEEHPVSPRTLQRWRRDGEGPAYLKLGGKLVRYRQSALDAYLAAATRTSTSQAA